MPTAATFVLQCLNAALASMYVARLRYLNFYLVATVPPVHSIQTKVSITARDEIQLNLKSSRTTKLAQQHFEYLK